MQTENGHHFINTAVWKEQLIRFKNLAKKYGFAMIALTLNTFIIPVVFVLPVSFISEFSGIDLLNSETDIGYYTIMLLNELSAYVFPVIILRYMFRQERRSFIPDRTYKPIAGEAVLMFMAGMAAGALGTVITEAINSVIDSIFHTGEIKEVFSGMEPQNIPQFAVFAFCICVIAPITEEYIFRDLLLKPLRAYGDTTAAIVTGLLFGLYHGNFDQFAYAALLGFFYSVIAIRYNSIIPTVILHSANNILVTISNYLPEAVKNEEQPVQDFINRLSEICSVSVVLMMLGGIAGFAILLGSKCFKLNNHNLYVPEPHSLIDFISTPYSVLGIIAMLIVFFV